MAEILLPRRIIANRCMPGGWRSAKKPVFVAPVRVHTSRDRFHPAEIPKVFENWEYRFWAMVLFNNRIISECRCCGAEGGTDTKERHAHYELGGCARRLCKAYSLLKRDKICVICDRKTPLTEWGVPMCSNGCKQQWCENEAQPKCLTAALLLVGDA